MAELNCDTFQPLIGNKFKIIFEENEILELELIRVDDKSNDAIESFSLIFYGPPNFILHQSIYRFYHELIGDFELFIVPVQSSTATAIHYQAIFNRFKK